jgi:hypothetical protein
MRSETIAQARTKKGRIGADVPRKPSSVDGPKAAPSGLFDDFLVLARAAFQEFGYGAGVKRSIGVELTGDDVLAAGLTLRLVLAAGDVDLDGRHDFGVQAKLHRMKAQRLDRTVEDDHGAVDFSAICVDGVGHVAPGN